MSDSRQQPVSSSCPPLHSLSTEEESTHPSFALHDPGPFIVERPARLRAIADALAAPAFDGLVRQEPPLAPTRTKQSCARMLRRISE